MEAQDKLDIYSNGRAALIGQLRSLTAEQRETVVAACPDWTVKDVAAHLSGLVAEALAGVPPPYGSPEATARQVNDRTNSAIGEICDEWETNGPAFAEYVAVNAPFITALQADLTVHSHDIAETLNLPIDENSAGTIVAAERYRELLQQRSADQLDIALAVEFTGADLRPAPAGVTPLTLTASAFDFLRSITGRRTPDQIRTLDWVGDPSELIATSFYQY